MIINLLFQRDGNMLPEHQKSLPLNTVFTPLILFRKFPVIWSSCFCDKQIPSVRGRRTSWPMPSAGSHLIRRNPQFPELRCQTLGPVGFLFGPGFRLFSHLPELSGVLFCLVGVGIRVPIVKNARRNHQPVSMSSPLCPQV